MADTKIVLIEYITIILIFKVNEATENVTR